MKIEDLRGMSEEELIRGHDTDMRNRAAHYNVYLDELARREAQRQGERMERLTRSMNALSIVVTIATIVGVVLTAWGLMFG